MIKTTPTKYSIKAAPLQFVKRHFLYLLIQFMIESPFMGYYAAGNKSGISSKTME